MRRRVGDVVVEQAARARVTEQARRAGVRLVRFLYTDNGGVTRGKSTHVSSLGARLTDGIGLEEMQGVKLDRGYVIVDEYMRTGMEHLYAIGDIVPRFALAHVASHEAVVAVEHLAGHDPEPVRMDLMPRVTFCRPQIASVGMTEAEAREDGREVKVGSFPFRALGKATIVGEVDGFAKLVADAESGLLLGAHLIGPHAGDLLAEPTLARLVQGTTGEIAMSVHAHPTLTEVLGEAALAVDGAAILPTAPASGVPESVLGPHL